MTAVSSELVDRLLADLHCLEAKHCYDESQLMKDIGAGNLSEDDIRAAFSHTRDCPYESAFQITKRCSCPFCESC